MFRLFSKQPLEHPAVALFRIHLREFLEARKLPFKLTGAQPDVTNIAELVAYVAALSVERYESIHSPRLLNDYQGLLLAVAMRPMTGCLAIMFRDCEDFRRSVLLTADARICQIQPRLNRIMQLGATADAIYLEASERKGQRDQLSAIGKTAMALIMEGAGYDETEVLVIVLCKLIEQMFVDAQ
jgi:hypothetical protein